MPAQISTINRLRKPVWRKRCAVTRLLRTNSAATPNSTVFLLQLDRGERHAHCSLVDDMHAQPSVRATVHDRFLADQKQLEALLEQLITACSAGDHGETDRLWYELNSGMLTRLGAGEAHLIPALFRASGRNARILVQEHRHIRAGLVELAADIERHALRCDSVRNFADEFRAHSRNEERILHTWADDHLDEAQCAAAIEGLKVSATPRAILPTSR